MKFRMIISLIIGIILHNVFGQYAATYIGSTLISEYYGEYALDNAIRETNESAVSSHPITKIYFAGGDWSHRLSASSGTFKIASDVNGLEIVGENNPVLNNGFEILGQNIHIHSDWFIFIELGYGHGTGVYDLGNNNTIENIYVFNGWVGIHTDGDNVIVNHCISDGSEIGFFGHGLEKTGNFHKIMAKNCSIGMKFYEGYYATIDRATAYNFKYYGITGSEARVLCKRCLVYGPVDPDLDYYYYNYVSFVNAWDDVYNDNVAMGDNCVSSGRAFNHCTGTDKIAYDYYPNNIDYPTFAYFIVDSADLMVRESYSEGDWASLTHSAPVMLCHYTYDSYETNYHYEDNVGYDTNITKGLGRVKFSTKESIPEKLKILASPNPFNSMVNISISVPSDIAIMDINGRIVGEFYDSREVNWEPKGLPSGVYTVIAHYPGGHVLQKIVYLK